MCVCVCVCACVCVFREREEVETNTEFLSSLYNCYSIPYLFLSGNELLLLLQEKVGKQSHWEAEKQDRGLLIVVVVVVVTSGGKKKGNFIYGQSSSRSDASKMIKSRHREPIEIDEDRSKANTRKRERERENFKILLFV